MRKTENKIAIFVRITNIPNVNRKNKQINHGFLQAVQIPLETAKISFF